MCSGRGGPLPHDAECHNQIYTFKMIRFLSASVVGLVERMFGALGSISDSIHVHAECAKPMELERMPVSRLYLQARVLNATDNAMLAAWLCVFCGIQHRYNLLIGILSRQ